MKNLIIKSLALSTVIVATSQLHAAVAVNNTYATGTGTNNVSLYSGPYNIQSFVAQNPSGVAQTVVIFDAPGLGITNVIPGYTNYAVSVVSVTNVYTNIFGAINTNIFSALTNTVVNTAQTTNNYRIVDSFSVASNSTVTRLYPEGAIFGIFGIGVTNGPLTNFTYTVTYTPFK